MILQEMLDQARSLAWRADPQAEEQMRMVDVTALIRSAYEAGVRAGAELAFVVAALSYAFPPEEPKP